MDVHSLNGGDEPMSRRPRCNDRHPSRKVNTSRLMEEDLMSLDSNEVEHVISADGWYAIFEDGIEEPLVAWAFREDGWAHGVIVKMGESGPQVDIESSVEDRPGFLTYVRR